MDSGTTQHVLAYSYGKDSGAAIYVIKEVLGWPLDRIVTADVWATDTIPADLPPMVEFKARADAIIKARWGIEVEHFCARDKNGEKITFEGHFYHIPQRKPKKMRGGGRYIPQPGQIEGWPSIWKPWCNGALKRTTMRQAGNLWVALPSHRKLVQKTQVRVGRFTGGRSSGGTGAPATSSAEFFGGPTTGADNTVVQYLGIAADEPRRIAKHEGRKNIKLPLVEAGWTEAMCREWCADNGLLSPIYTTATRGGCWFCHNQSVGQLRLLRKMYPEYWALMLKWDADSPVSFHPDGHTVHDFERRFQMEDEHLLIPDDPRFKWAMLDQELNFRLF